MSPNDETSFYFDLMKLVYIVRILVWAYHFFYNIYAQLPAAVGEWARAPLPNRLEGAS